MEFEFFEALLTILGAALVVAIVFSRLRLPSIIAYIVAGALLGVDPLDQPGVEAGKRLTYAMAGRAGYEELVVEVEEQLAKKKEDLVLGCVGEDAGVFEFLGRHEAGEKPQ